MFWGKICRIRLDDENVVLFGQMIKDIDKVRPLQNVHHLLFLHGILALVNVKLT